MSLQKVLNLKGVLLLALSLMFTSCSKDDMPDETTGEVAFEMTDAPIDDTNVKGVFVTVVAVTVDGEAISDFQGAATIDLMAYQNGNTKALGLANLEAGTYSQVGLVLDYDMDASGNSPGCYVLTNDNAKHELQATASSTNEIILNASDFEVEENSTSKMVIDFDIRKAIAAEANSSNEDQYNFVTDSELKSSLRLVKKEESSAMEGEVADNLGVAGDRIVVYAYKKGTFNEATEASGQGQSQIWFKNAVTSAVVAQDGSYNLSFLEEGEYELHFVGYEDSDNDGKMEVKGKLQVSATGVLDILGIQLSSAAQVSIDVAVLAVIPF